MVPCFICVSQAFVNWFRENSLESYKNKHKTSLFNKHFNRQNFSKNKIQMYNIFIIKYGMFKLRPVLRGYEVQLGFPSKNHKVMELTASTLLGSGQTLVHITLPTESRLFRSKSPCKYSPMAMKFNPSNAKATFVQSTRTQIFLKTN